MTIFVGNLARLPTDHISSLAPRLANKEWREATFWRSRTCRHDGIYILGIIKKRKGNRRFKDLESITSDFHTCRGTGRAAQQDGSDGGG